MQFFPNYPTDNNKGQRQVWNALKRCLGSDEGEAYYGFPIFSTQWRGRKEPDFLLVHRRYGIWVFESKGCFIGNVKQIQGHEWVMHDWYSDTMCPLSQLDAQFWEVKRLIESDPAIKALRIPTEFRLLLPLIKRQEWCDSGFSKLPTTEGAVLLEEDLEPSALRAELAKANTTHTPTLTDAQWRRVLAVFRGTANLTSDAAHNAASLATGLGQIVHTVQSRMRVLDEKQSRVAQEVPEGPQRIRGLAGCGKTVLLAKRIAQIHAQHPEWDIAFVFFSRSLYQQVKELVRASYKRLVDEEPNWDKLHVWHAWGSKTEPGFYSEVAKRWGCVALNLEQAKHAAKGNESPFEAACSKLEAQSKGATQILDAVVIDEGQDLPPAFYRIAYRALREPKRLYWAYDEAQGINSLLVPAAATIFGRTPEGKPIVDLSGSYQSGMQKSHNLNRSYRTAKVILTAAQAINMGLLREKGPLQGVTTKEDWNQLGYDVLDGDFSSASVRDRKHVIIERRPTACGHPIDAADFGHAIDHSTLLKLEVVTSEDAAVRAVVAGIQRDLEGGLAAHNLAVISLGRTSVLKRIGDELQRLGIKVFALDNSNRDGFRQLGCVTLSSIQRAKGNEAVKVYAVNLHLAGAPYVEEAEEELKERNKAFVALTRSKIWCVAVGLEGAIMTELQQAKTASGRLSFPAFNQTSLRRTMEDADGAQPEFW